MPSERRAGPPRIHVIGRKNHGKTQLVEDLVRWYAAQGLKVATIKHTHHHHELDTPGKDSHRHRLAGARAVGILAREMTAIFLPRERSVDDAERYEAFAAAFADCDLIVVEGDTQATAPKIEVWRAAIGGPPLAQADARIVAVVSDDVAELAAWQLPQPTWPRSDIERLAPLVRAASR